MVAGTKYQLVAHRVSHEGPFQSNHSKHSHNINNNNNNTPKNFPLSLSGPITIALRADAGKWSRVPAFEEYPMELRRITICGE